MIVEFTSLNIWMIISEVISLIYLLLKFIRGNTNFFQSYKKLVVFLGLDSKNIFIVEILIIFRK